MNRKLNTAFQNELYEKYNVRLSVCIFWKIVMKLLHTALILYECYHK
jgi:hypothetical protein